MSKGNKKPVTLDSLSDKGFNVEIEKGYTDMKEGNVRPASDVFADLQKNSVNAIRNAQKAFDGVAEKLGNPGEDEINLGLTTLDMVKTPISENPCT